MKAVATLDHGPHEGQVATDADLTIVEAENERAVLLARECLS